MTHLVSISEILQMTSMIESCSHIPVQKLPHEFHLKTHAQFFLKFFKLSMIKRSAQTTGLLVMTRVHLVCAKLIRGDSFGLVTYIMRFLDLNNLLHPSAKTTCSKDEILAALEGVFLLEYRLSAGDATELFSGWSYGEFRQRYAEKLQQSAMNRSDHVEENIYANTLYDQVWTFALALNASLPSIASQNLSFENYSIGNTKAVTEILKNKMIKLSFQGASGWIEFNEQQEVPSFIDIFQFRSGTPVQIGVYDPFARNVTFDMEYFPEYIPKDTFETFYDLIPSWLGGLMLTAQVILFVSSL